MKNKMKNFLSLPLVQVYGKIIDFQLFLSLRIKNLIFEIQISALWNDVESETNKNL